MSQSIGAEYRPVCGTCTGLPPKTNVLLVDYNPKGRMTHSLLIDCRLAWQIPSTCARTASAMRCFKIGSNPYYWAYRNPVKSSLFNHYANQFCEDKPLGNLQCYPLPQSWRQINNTMPLFASTLEINQGIPILHFRPMAKLNQENRGNLIHVMFMLIIQCAFSSNIRYVWALSSYERDVRFITNVPSLNMLNNWFFGTGL